MTLLTKRAFGVVENSFQIGRASGALSGANQGCAISVVAGSRPLMLTHVLAQIVTFQSTTLNFVRALAINGDVPADVTGLQGNANAAASYYPPAQFGNAISGSLLWQQFAEMGNGSNSSTTPVPNVKQDFTFGPIVQPGEILTVMAFPMINAQAADFTSLLWMQLCAWGRTLSDNEAAAVSGGSSGGNVRALPVGLAGR